MITFIYAVLLAKYTMEILILLGLLIPIILAYIIVNKDRITDKVIQIVIRNMNFTSILGSLIPKQEPAKGTLWLDKYMRIPYEHKGKQYIVNIPLGEKKSPITSAIGIDKDKKEIDITKTIYMLAGPYNNFYNLDVTVKDVVRGFEEVTIYYKDGSEATFSKDITF